MVTCQIPGHANSYGLGIRVAFYLQWYGIIITCWFLESDALNFQFLNGLTILATSVGLALNIGLLQPAEIYVVLLLVCGTLYFLVPMYLWRLLTCCRPWWDTERWNRIKMEWLFRTGMALLFGTMLGLQIWFWCTGVYTRPAGTDTGCQQYGFLLGQLRLDSPALTAVNIVIHTAMLTWGVLLFCNWIGMFDDCRWRRRRKKQRWSITHARVESLQQFRTISDALVAAIVITAVELVISWNEISGVNTLDSAAQLLPLAVSAAYFLRSTYVWLSGPAPTDSHYMDFPYFGPTGGGGGGGGGGDFSGSWSYHASNGAGHPRRHRHRHRHHHSHRPRHRRSAYGPGTGEPVVSTAYSRRVTMVDVPDEGLAAAPAAQVPEPQPVHESA